ncbi:MAG: hypothetical protein QM765_15505 [Myxococcales bacterium]
MKKWTWLAAALIAVPALARAQGVTTYEDEYTNRKFDVNLQGGIGGYTGNAQDVTTDVGPSYGAMVTFNPFPALSYELGYIGNTNSISRTDSRLSSNRVQLDVKAGPPLGGPVVWRPYLFAGVAGNFMVAGGSRLTTGWDDSFQGEIPMGAGVDFLLNTPVRVGARGTFDWNPGVGGSAGIVSDHPSAWQAALTAAAAF